MMEWVDKGSVWQAVRDRKGGEETRGESRKIRGGDVVQPRASAALRDEAETT